MDPQACLRDCYEALFNREEDVVFDRLYDYWQWRGGGGFEPPSGDLIARLLESAYVSKDVDLPPRIRSVVRRYLDIKP